MKTKAFSIVEIILATAIFLIICSASIVSIISGQSLNQTSAEQTIATQFATEGLEATLSIKNQSFSNLADSVGTGVGISGGLYTFSGSNNIFDKYTRVITVSTAQRDGSGNIVSSGGTSDPDTKKVTSTVTWNVAGARNNSVILTNYLTNYRQTIIGNWSLPTLQSALDLSGNNDGTKVAVQGNYAYVLRSGATPNFQIINISNLASPTLSGSLSVAANPVELFVSGNYAYIASTANATELQIIDISNPASPTIAGNYDATGNQNARAVYVIGNTAYLTRDSSGTELMAINVTNHASPSLLGSIALAANNTFDIVVQGNYAYVASADNSGEFKVIDVSNPASMTLAGTVNLTGNGDGLTIAGSGNYMTVTRNGELNVINITTPTSPTLVGTLAFTGNPLDSHSGNSGNYIYVGTTDNAADLKVFNITTPASPALLGTYNASGNIFGVYYASSIDRAVCVSASNTEEFIIVQPS